MRNSLFIGSAVAALFSQSALAQEEADQNIEKTGPKAYAEVALANIAVDYDIPVINTKLDASYLGLVVRAGYNFNKYLAIEGDGIFTFSSEEVYSTIDVRPSGTIAGYVRANLPLGESFKLYARGGYSQVSYLYESPNFDLADDEFVQDQHAGPSYGAGAQFNLTDTMGIRADYTVFAVDGSDVSSASIGAVMAF